MIGFISALGLKSNRCAQKVSRKAEKDGFCCEKSDPDYFISS
jgi:hypothetical protein